MRNAEGPQREMALEFLILNMKKGRHQLGFLLVRMEVMSDLASDLAR
ncbi:hypothetical protein RHIZ404_210261 [Rhizobium sp. EC-SD404]|nr:hypothetical protein RHIZ404_210261 [Rhizobium sp. EC-SD404]